MQCPRAFLRETGMTSGAIAKGIWTLPAAHDETLGERSDAPGKRTRRAEPRDERNHRTTPDARSGNSSAFTGMDRKDSDRR